jgi:hypothetical protein
MEQPHLLLPEQGQDMIPQGVKNGMLVFFAGIYGATASFWGRTMTNWPFLPS